MPGLLLVMIGGAIGAALRYEVGRLVLDRGGTGFPWSTLIVNLAGGLAMGVLAGFMFNRSPDQNLWLFAGVGLLGGFTTFSAFSLDMFAMIEHGQIVGAAFYATASVLGSLGLLAAAFWLMRAAAA